MNNNLTAKVSVVVPVYNSESWIQECLDSVRSQTHRPIELVVVDDGSTDRSAEVVESWMKENLGDGGFTVRFIRQENLGAPAARNRGAREATGDYLQFLDADDCLYPEKISRQLAHTIKLPEMGLSFCGWDVTEVDSDREPRRVAYPHWENPEDCVPPLCAGHISTLSPIHRREEFLTTGGFDESLSCGQEYDLHQRMACLGFRFFYHPEPGFLVRKVPGSVGSNKARGAVEQRKILRRNYDLLEERGTLTPLRARAFARAFIAGAVRLMWLGKWRESWRSAWAARNLHPYGACGWGMDLLRALAVQIIRRMRLLIKRKIS